MSEDNNTPEIKLGEGRPHISVRKTGYGTKHGVRSYVLVIQKNLEGKQCFSKSFGNAKKKENWEAALTYLHAALRLWNEHHILTEYANKYIEE